MADKPLHDTIEKKSKSIARLHHLSINQPLQSNLKSISNEENNNPITSINIHTPSILSPHQSKSKINTSFNDDSLTSKLGTIGFKNFCTDIAEQSNDKDKIDHNTSGDFKKFCITSYDQHHDNNTTQCHSKDNVLQNNIKSHHPGEDLSEIPKNEIQRLENVLKDSTPTLSHDQPHSKENYQKRYIIDNLNEPWNYRIMLQLQQIGEKALGYRWMHNEEMIYYTNERRKFMILDLLIAGVIGALISGDFIAMFSKDQNFTLFFVLTLIQAIMFALSLIIKGYREGMDFSIRISDHREISSRLSEIASSIKIQFSIPISERDNDKNFMEYRTTQFDEAIGTAPVIRPCTTNRYLDMVKNSYIANQFSINNMGQIEIVLDKKDEQPSTINQPCDPCNPLDNNFKINDCIEQKLQYEIDRFFNRYV